MLTRGVLSERERQWVSWVDHNTTPAEIASKFYWKPGKRDLFEINIILRIKYTVGKREKNSKGLI